MFNIFRRSSKGSATSSSCSRQSSLATTCSMSTKPKTSFFSLPGELRNRIYNLVAEGRTLRLKNATINHKKTTSTRRRHSTTDDPIPSLFITSKQCRSEYLTILLSSAKLHIQIIDFDFHRVIRLIGSLYCSELKSLRLNPNLILALSFTPRSFGKMGEMESNLRRWVQHRSLGLDRLPWRYRLGAESTSSVFVVSYNRCMTILKMGQCKLEESLGWEIQRIMDVVEVPSGSDGVQFGKEYLEFERGRLWSTAVAHV